MKSLVIYDSNYGNTKIIAEAIAKGLSTKAVTVESLGLEEFNGLDMIIVGSPINGWRPSPKMITFLSNLKEGQLNNIKAATFDTRIKAFFHGDAMKNIAKNLQKAGAQIVATSEAFVVKGKEGPLVEGEVERAEKWGAQLSKVD